MPDTRDREADRDDGAKLAEAPKAPVAPKIHRRGLRYIGAGAFFPNVPARDLDAETLTALAAEPLVLAQFTTDANPAPDLRATLIASGLYEAAPQE